MAVPHLVNALGPGDYELAAGDVEQLRASLAATRSVLKSHARSTRTALQFVTDLEEQLDQFERLSIAQPKEAQRHEHPDAGRAG